MTKYSDLFDIDTELCLDFFIIFSRFEYSLKRSGYITGNDKKCEANWDEFFKKYKDEIKKLSKKRYFQDLLKNPPKKQIITDGKLAWKLNKYTHEYEAINNYIRCVRNNLFHGGKFPMTPVDEPARNKQLILNCKEILLILKDLDENIKNNFEPDI